MVIDLSPMRAVSVDPKAKTVTAQGGCLWSDVDTAAGAHDLMTVGGTINHTGIGGLTLGGGYGWFTGKHGLTIDNLLAAEVVLASGRIVTCSEEENADLFWAIRGAGANFGVTTSFTYRCHDQKNRIFTGLLAFPTDKLDPLVNVLNEMIASATTGDKAALLGFACPPPAFHPTVLCVIMFNGSEAAAKEAFAPLYSLGPVHEMTSSMPYFALNGSLNALATAGERKSSKGSSFRLPLQPSLAREIFEKYAAFVTEIPDANPSVVIFDFISRKKITEVSQTATAFSNRGNYQNVGVDFRWREKANDDVVRQATRDFANLFKEEMARGATEMEAGVGVYGNFYRE